MKACSSRQDCSFPPPHPATHAVAVRLAVPATGARRGLAPPSHRLTTTASRLALTRHAPWAQCSTPPWTSVEDVSPAVGEDGRSKATLVGVGLQGGLRGGITRPVAAHAGGRRRPL